MSYFPAANNGCLTIAYDPDGVLTAPRGTLAIDTTTGAVYQNTSGTTAWKALMQPTIRWISGRYYFVPDYTGTGAATLTTALLRAVPFIVPNTVTLTKIGAEVTIAGEAGSKYRLGIYSNTDGRPDALLLDAGTIAGDSATVQELTISLTLTPGVYWAAGVTQVVVTTQPTMRVSASGTPVIPIDNGTTVPGAGAVPHGWAIAGITGALPNPFGTPVVSGSTPRIFVKA